MSDDELSALSRQVQRLVDVHEISNLMSRMVYLGERWDYEGMLLCFAQHTPGVTVEIGRRGVFEGIDGARRTLVEIGRLMDRGHAAGMREAFPDLTIADDAHVGRQENQAIATPLIEVAGDGQTAKGLWSSPVSQTQFDPGVGKPAAYWLWIRYAVDFVREPDGWRIWHFHLIPRFRTPFERSWVEASATPLRPPPGLPEPDRPTTEYFDSYEVTQGPKDVPQLPEPYDTFDHTFSY
jgi:hypothetical protein